MANLGNAAIRSVAAGQMAASLALGLCWTAPARADDGQPTEAEQRPIIVVGKKVDAAELDRIATDPIDTPQTISTISREELERRGTTNLNDALRNVAGLSLGAGETSFQGNNAILRGFTTRNDLFLDNARDYGYYYRDTFDDQQIEVLKGPSSILFGRGSTGGVIHRVSKKPQRGSLLNLDGQIGTSDLARIAIDANFAAPDGLGPAIRLNGFAHHNAVAGRDGARNDRWGIAPAVTFGLGTETRVALRHLHQTERDRPDYGIPWFAGTPAAPGRPVPVSRTNYYGFANDRLNADVNLVTARIEHDFGAALQWRTQLRYSSDSRDFRYSEAILPSSVAPGDPLGAVIVGRNLFEGSGRDRFLQGHSEVQAGFDWGATHHDLIAGVEAGREASAPLYFTNLAVPTTSLIAPSGGDYDNPANRFVRLRGHSRSRFIGLFAIDTISVGDHWRAILALRWDSFHTDYRSQRFSQAGAIDRDTDVARTDRRLGYRGAIVYKPSPSGSFYAGYANAFNPSGEGIESLISSGRSVGQSNLNLAPETSWSIEIGTKWSLFGDRLLLSAALFRIEKDNVRVPDPATPGFNILGGRQRVDGFEIEASGSPLPGLHLRADYSLLDSKTLRSTAAGPLVGAPLVLTPRHSGAISIGYDVTPRVEIGANLVGQSARLGQNSAALYLEAPGYVVLDLSASYRLTSQVRLGVIVNNIADRLYYDQLHPFHVIPGAGRSALLEVKVAL